MLKLDASTLMRTHKWRLVIAVLLLLVDRATAFVLPTATKYIIDGVLVEQNNRFITYLLVIASAAAVIQISTSLSLLQLIGLGAARAVTELRAQLQHHLCRLPLRYFDSNKVGSLATRVMTDTENVKNLLGMNVVEIAGGIVTALIALILVARISLLLTLTVLLWAPLMFVVSRYGFHVMRRLFQKRAQVSAEISGRLVESYSGIRTIKGFNAESIVSARFADNARQLLFDTKRIILMHATISSGSRLLRASMNIVILGISGRLLADRAITIGDFFAFSAYVTLLMEPLTRPAGTGTQLAEGAASLDRIAASLGERAEDEDAQRTVVIARLQGHVVFRDVAFEYVSGEPVLEEISFEATPGSVTAVVGPSGAGKSTLVSLVAAFIRPIAGRVEVDGVDLATVTLSSYRSQLGVVLQDNFLFDGTIAENILLGRATASYEEMIVAATAAKVDEFALRLPSGYDTLVGERGVRLSGGQRQRIAIARAIVAVPRILILDEATSSLDAESEWFVQEALRKLMMQRTTTFVIAHRLNTVCDANQILVLDHGRIIDRGTHEELDRRCLRYRQIFNNRLRASV
jgi:ABC-type multidrug transport system fused ATPase/permease subunit